jgi:DNA/RNA endonuclease YhcR with UshA esterase domain
MKHPVSYRLAIFVIALALASPAFAANLTPEQASSHVGQVETVCGIVASAHYAERTRSQPTFLNLGQAYPNQVFTAVIFGSDRAKFGQPETLQGKNVCVSGKIEVYRGKPEIILHDRGQLEEE